ncbi:hypothetical protein PFISCL1PPCAC_12942, partial [Pristionchus fissidentatus]
FGRPPATKRTLHVHLEMRHPGAHLYVRMRKLNSNGRLCLCMNPHNAEAAPTSYYFEVAPDDFDFFALLKQIVHTFLVHVEFIDLDHTSGYARSALNGVKVSHFSFRYEKLTQDESERIVYDLRLREIHKATIKIRVDYIDNPRYFLLQVANLVDAVHLEQENIGGPNRSYRYLFGLKNHDWVNLISEMLNRRVSKIKIDNSWYSHINSSNEAHTLAMEELSKPKACWLHTTTRGGFEV